MLLLDWSPLLHFKVGKKRMNVSSKNVASGGVVDLIGARLDLFDLVIQPALGNIFYMVVAISFFISVNFLHSSRWPSSERFQ